MTTDRNEAPTTDWQAIAKKMVADLRAAEAKRGDAMQGMSAGFQNAARRGAARHATKNYGNAIGSRKYTGLW